MLCRVRITSRDGIDEPDTDEEWQVEDITSEIPRTIAWTGRTTFEEFVEGTEPADEAAQGAPGNVDLPERPAREVKRPRVFDQTRNTDAPDASSVIAEATSVPPVASEARSSTDITPLRVSAVSNVPDALDERMVQAWRDRNPYKEDPGIARRTRGAGRGTRQGRDADRAISRGAGRSEDPERSRSPVGNEDDSQDEPQLYAQDDEHE